jgi:fanconi anemia group J protein
MAEIARNNCKCQCRRIEMLKSEDVDDDLKKEKSDDSQPTRKVKLEKLKVPYKKGEIKYDDSDDSSLSNDDSSDNENSLQNSFENKDDNTNCKCICHRFDNIDITKTSPAPTSTPNTKTNENDSQLNDNYNIPKIFFATRTHKQITNIVKELKKTKYGKSIRMTILSSRAQTCIHSVVSKRPNKDESCKNLRKEGIDKGIGGDNDDNEVVNVRSTNIGCQFFTKTKQKPIPYEGFGFKEVWDIEEFVNHIKRKRLCPYYVARDLIDDAEIIFCPYNYLIDPRIRSSMGIKIENEILIIDEAHNIEDTCRDATTFKITKFQLETCSEELIKSSKYWDKRSLADSADYFTNIFVALNKWIDSNIDSMAVNNYDGTAMSRIWTGPEMVDIFKSDYHRIFIGPGTQYSIYSSHMSKLFEQGSDDTASNINDPTKLLIEHLHLVLTFLYMDNGKFCDDFRIGITKTKTAFSQDDTDTAETTSTQFRNFNGQQQGQWTFTIHFWCMNPAVSFHHLKKCHSIILASGTLSPMDTFQSELDTKFELILEAKHVISDEQVLVGALSHGPNNVSLLTNYKTTESFSYQDEICHVISDICKTMPFGVLCFLPSYQLLSKLLKRWTETRMIDKISKYKEIFSESRVSKDFDQMLTDFYDCIHSKRQNDQNNGAIMFAVYRGRASEGLDFSDNYCRAVIAIGIPFPNYKDTQVDLKIKYNNRYCKERGLLTGDKWYEIQAYRAVNQALGRCIRHRNDWGSIIMIDERYVKQKEKYSSGLSKWIRSRFIAFNNYKDAFNSIINFKKEIQIFQNELEIKQEKNIKSIETVCKIESPKKEIDAFADADTDADPKAVSKVKSNLFSIFTPPSNSNVKKSKNNKNNKNWLSTRSDLSSSPSVSDVSPLSRGPIKSYKRSRSNTSPLKSSVTEPVGKKFEIYKHSKAQKFQINNQCNSNEIVSLDESKENSVVLLGK